MSARLHGQFSTKKQQTDCSVCGRLQESYRNRKRDPRFDNWPPYARHTIEPRLTQQTAGQRLTAKLPRSYVGDMRDFGRKSPHMREMPKR